MRADRIVRSLVRQRFVITLHDGTTFAGVLVDADPHTFVLADATQLGSNGDRLAVDGCLYLDRAQIAYAQRPEGVSHA